MPSQSPRSQPPSWFTVTLGQLQEWSAVSIPAEAILELDRRCADLASGPTMRESLTSLRERCDMIRQQLPAIDWAEWTGHQLVAELARREVVMAILEAGFPQPFAFSVTERFVIYMYVLTCNAQRLLAENPGESFGSLGVRGPACQAAFAIFAGPEIGQEITRRAARNIAGYETATLAMIQQLAHQLGRSDLFPSEAAAAVDTLRQLSWATSPIAGLRALNMVRDDDDPVKADARQRADLRQEINGQILLTIAAECGARDALDLLARALDGEFRQIPTAVVNDLKSKLRHERLRTETTVVLPTGVERDDEPPPAMVPEGVKLESGNIPPRERDRELEKGRRDRRRREKISIKVVEDAHGQNRWDSAPDATTLLEQLWCKRPDLRDGLNAALSPLPRNEQAQRDGVSRGTTINRVNRVRQLLKGKTEKN